MKRKHADIYKVPDFSDSSSAYFAATVYADRVDILRSRARMLKGRDRAIMIMYLDKGNSIAQIARVAGVTEAVMSRRVRRLMARLIDNPFILCLQHRGVFDPIEIDVAKDFFLVGRSLSTISESRAISVYRIRKILARIKAFKKRISKIRSRNV